MFDLEEKREEEIKRMVSTLIQLDLAGINLLKGKADTLLEYQNELKKEGAILGIDRRGGPVERRLA